MATIRARQRRDGSVAFLAEIRIKRGGVLTHRESQIFERRALAKAWAENREKALASTKLPTKTPIEDASTTLREVLKRYREEISEVRSMERSKASSIRFLEKCEISRLDVLELNPSDAIAHIRSRRQTGAGPSTANNDLVWLRVILRYARATRNIPTDLSLLEDAGAVLKAEKMITKARS